METPSAAAWPHRPEGDRLSVLCFTVNFTSCRGGCGGGRGAHEGAARPHEERGWGRSPSPPHAPCHQRERPGARFGESRPVRAQTRHQPRGPAGRDSLSSFSVSSPQVARTRYSDSNEEPSRPGCFLRLTGADSALSLMATRKRRRPNGPMHFSRGASPVRPPAAFAVSSEDATVEKYLLPVAIQREGGAWVP